MRSYEEGLVGIVLAFIPGPMYPGLGTERRLLFARRVVCARCMDSGAARRRSSRDCLPAKLIVERQRIANSVAPFFGHGIPGARDATLRDQLSTVDRARCDGRGMKEREGRKERKRERERKKEGSINLCSLNV